MRSLYRMFNAEGDLLYIGCSYALPARLEQHRCRRNWWGEVATVTVEHFETHAEGWAAECDAIIAEVPRYNSLPSAAQLRWRERALRSEAAS